ncbi:multidrug efflux SMR transporter [Arthrobacter sp. ISL-65]|uniref:DMT family transporter n=1 Tax=Arthrobacter sp. ISL-65 TaxID=2819112 RepID=UPI001BEC9BAE|nr:SMR family transporter [Arthrobacter sp. ISL-65]MBT2547440.1 QacE family quaternary ammonium compound efflux SMR transporter [Arthrobacter sp. ISL-65]
MKKWLSLGGAVLTEVSATLALKAAIEAPGWYVLVVVGYIAAFGLLTVCLRTGMTISVAYGAWGAGGVTTTALLSALIFDETLTWLMGLGMMFILAGVVTVELGSQNAKRPQQERDAK